MQTFKAESSGLRQRLAAEQREVGSLKHSLADRNLAKRQATQVPVYLTLSFAGVLTHLDSIWALSSCRAGLGGCFSFSDCSECLFFPLPDHSIASCLALPRIATAHTPGIAHASPNYQQPSHYVATWAWHPEAFERLH